MGGPGSPRWLPEAHRVAGGACRRARRARISQEEPGGVGRSQEEPGEARSQEEPGGPGSSLLLARMPGELGEPGDQEEPGEESPWGPQGAPRSPLGHPGAKAGTKISDELAKINDELAFCWRKPAPSQFFRKKT